jgi:hypothetical protein
LTTSRIDFNQSATQNRATDVARQLSNKTIQLAQEEAHLAAISRDLVSALGVLKKAEAAAQKICNPAMTGKIEQIKVGITNLRRHEDVATRIVAAQTAGLTLFLAEGSPTNGELLEASKAYEEILATVGRL